MKNLLILVLIILNFNNSFGQKNEKKLLKNYNFYIEKNKEIGKWRTKYFLSNGLITIKENYWKSNLVGLTKLEYDEHDNVIKEILIFDPNNNIDYDTINYTFKYQDNKLIERRIDFGMIEKYSDFNENGDPQLIERADEKIWPFKEILNYDENGNIIKTIEFSKYLDIDNKWKQEIATTYYRYNNYHDIIEIHREFEPKQEFPIIIIGGPAKYEFEYYRYKYNKDGLWIKKFETVQGKEKLIAKRKFKNN